jgi:hypothetical protein
MRATRVAAAISVPTLALLLAGCSGSGPGSPSDARFGSINSSLAQSGTTGGGVAAGAAGAPAAPGALSLANKGTTFNGAPVDGGVARQSIADAGHPALQLGTPEGRIERSVNAHFVVPHSGFLSAFEKLIEKAVSLGGYVVDSSTSPDSSGRIDSGTLTVRVPAARLNDMVTGAPSDWRLSSIDYASVDHTAETVDLQARLRAAVAHRDALEGLLAGTHNLQDITALEQQIAQVQQEVEEDQGAVDAVNGKVDMGTATIGLTEKGVVAPPPPSPTPTLLRALDSGAGNALAVIAAITEGLLSALPLLVLAVIGLAVAWRAGLLRRLRRAPSTLA